MADGVKVPGTGTVTVATEEVSELNGLALDPPEHIQRLMLSLGIGDGAAVDAPGDLAHGIDVDVTRSALPDGAATDAAVTAVHTALTDGSVRGTVALDAPTLAALETITVGLDAPSLAALESITAVGPLTDTQLRAAPVPVDTEFPPAAPLTDADANPTAPYVAAANMLWDPSAATWRRMKTNFGDGAAVSQLPGMGPMVYNGTSWDRLCSAESAQGTTGTGLLGVGSLIHDGTNWVRQRTANAVANATTGAGIGAVGGMLWDGGNWQLPRNAQGADGGTGAGGAQVGPYIYNGASWDRLRSAEVAQNTTGTGLLGVGNLVYDGTNWQRIRAASAGDGASQTAGASIQAGAFNFVFNGTSWDRARGSLGDAAAGTGLLANLGMIYNGTNNDRMRSVEGANATTTGILATNAMLYNGSNYVRQGGADLSADASNGRSFPGAGGFRYNGATWDKERGNTDGTLLASAARTATATSANITNYNGRGIVIYLNVTAAVAGTGGLTVRIQGIDPISGNAFQLHVTPAAKTAPGVYAYELGPGATTGGGDLQNAYAALLPRTFNVSVVHGDATSYTYSVGYSLIV